MEQRHHATMQSKAMAAHAVRCNSCLGNYRLMKSDAGHLVKLEALSAIEWCATKAAGRRAHA